MACEGLFLDCFGRVHDCQPKASSTRDEPLLKTVGYRCSLLSLAPPSLDYRSHCFRMLRGIGGTGGLKCSSSSSSLSLGLNSIIPGTPISLKDSVLLVVLLLLRLLFLVLPILLILPLISTFHWLHFSVVAISVPLSGMGGPMRIAGVCRRRRK
jgi:hypothetical protein